MLNSIPSHLIKTQWQSSCYSFWSSPAMTNELWYPASPSFSLSPSRFTSHSIDYWNTLRSLPLFTSPCWSPSPFPPPFVQHSLPSCSTLSCTIHLANLIFGVDMPLNQDPFFHIHLSPSPDLSFPSRSFTPFLFCLPPFLGILIMKSGSSPSSALAAFGTKRDQLAANLLPLIP